MSEKFIRFKVRKISSFAIVRYYETEGLPDRDLYSIAMRKTASPKIYAICETLMLHLIGKYAV